MDFADAALIAGMCVIAVCVLIVGRTIWTTLRASGEELRQRKSDHGLRLDLYLGFVWSGMLLVQASSVLRHIEAGGSGHLSSLAIAATAGNIFVCGCFAGRLLLRREMRLCKEQQSGVLN